MSSIVVVVVVGAILAALIARYAHGLLRVVSAEILNLKVAARMLRTFDHFSLAYGAAQKVMLFLQFARFGVILPTQQLVVLTNTRRALYKIFLRGNSKYILLALNSRCQRLLLLDPSRRQDACLTQTLD